MTTLTETVRVKSTGCEHGGHGDCTAQRRVACERVVESGDLSFPRVIVTTTTL